MYTVCCVRLRCGAEILMELIQMGNIINNNAKSAHDLNQIHSNRQ